MAKIFSEILRYYNNAKIFNFFIHHKYVYIPIFVDLFSKKVPVFPYVRPRNIVVKLSSRCNANCKFCYAKNETRSMGTELKIQDWKDVIDQAKELGCYTITFTGGEPLIYPGLTELVRYSVSRGLLPFTTTNGLTAIPEKVKELEHAGLCALSFSLHGPKHNHDEIVGVKGAFNRVLENGEYCAKNTKIICLVNHVLTQDSVKNAWYSHVWELMRSRGFRAINLLPVCANSEDTSNLLSHEQLQVMDNLAKEPHVLMDTKNYSRPRCPAARDDFLITNYGEVQPCPFIPISFGNIRNDPLKKIFLRIQQHPMFEKEKYVCLPARDQEFIKNYIVPVFKQASNADGIPADINKIFPVRNNK